MRRYGWIMVVLVLLASLVWLQRARTPAIEPIPSPVSRPLPDIAPRARDALPSLPPAREASRWPAFLPPEALVTLQRIQRGGPHPYRQDGGSFHNRERLLPSQPRGYYREYTVDMPGARDRGPRRIVAGGDPPVEYFYSDDHYRSFRRFQPLQTEAQR